LEEEQMKSQAPNGKLFIVATPIGNLQDITLRALSTLRSVQNIICEEPREGSTLLRRLKIDGKELISLNEHNEREQTPLIIQKLKSGEDLALISDCGTPVFADPGATLIQAAHTVGIHVVPIPGVSSLMTALSVLDEPYDQFHFMGFLPREHAERAQRLAAMQSLQIPVILMDTPYRLNKLLQEIRETFGGARRITIGCDLTLPSEWIETGSCEEILEKLPYKKAEFILIIHPNR
jgi:16S rRNA (cytidine1402-2'-O)-methyltransferase